jgi:hypothetical protein
VDIFAFPLVDAWSSVDLLADALSSFGSLADALPPFGSLVDALPLLLLDGLLC